MFSSPPVAALGGLPGPLFCAMSFSEFVSARPYRIVGCPADLTDMSALRADFDAAKTSCAVKDGFHLDWRLMPLGDSMAFAIRYQLGADVFYSLGDLTDPRLWAQLDAWAARGWMVYVPTFDAIALSVVSQPFAMTPALQALRPAAGSQPESELDFEMHLLQLDTRALLDTEDSAVPGVEAVRNVQLSIVRTDSARARAVWIETRLI